VKQSSELMSLLIRLNKLRATMMFTESKEMGLSGPQLFILRELFIEQPKTLGDLAKALELSNSTVSGVIDRLEKQGLVERTRDDKDRRIVWVSTTATCDGLKKERLQKMQQQIRDELEKKYTPEQFALLRSVLETLIEQLEIMLEGNQ
jgi:DNA-binding MarR family transcriptional regulator